ncbi:MAG TPA: ABC transporter permease [Candidatus Parabacteroides intestinipullorum]|uniref:ABC transporter permease n=1 Tax=Candidatus Parabacteroides intestinipullorum TaxID=2838723 RepID=A0A9D2BHE9_9BACT|nr:ABC transporter permease [Candidatus Parabacteroides intestinipullorum]
MKLILRNLMRIFRRFRTAMILNILGLAVAFTAFMLLMMQWNYDRQFDRNDPNADRIFRIDAQWDAGRAALTCGPYGFAFMQSSPHIVGGCLLYLLPEDESFTIESDGEQRIFKDKLHKVTSGLTQVFHFDLVEGDTSALEAYDKILIPESAARRWFGQKAATGRQVTLGDGRTLSVGGVYRDFPNNNSLKNNIYVAIRKDQNESEINEWTSMNFAFYIRLDQGGTADAQALVDAFAENNQEFKNYRQANDKIDMVAIALTDIHTFEPLMFDPTPRTSPATMFLLFSIAIIILLIAAINYTNFSTALSPMRVRNVNTQKVFGASQASLRGALLAEAVIICLVAFLIGLLLLWGLQDYNLNLLIQADIRPEAHLPLIGLTALIALAIGLLAGLYPAYYTTSFAPALVLKGSFGLSPKGRMLRNLLMSFQFIASFALVIGALCMFLQNRYAQTMPLGFDKEWLVTSDIDKLVSSKRQVLEERLKQHPEVAGVAFSEMSFYGDNDIYAKWGRKFKGEAISFEVLVVSPSFPKVIGIPIIEGRDFREEDARNTNGCFIINRMMREHHGIQPGDKIGTQEIVGVTDNFHYTSMRRGISPMAFYTSDKSADATDRLYTNVYVRMNAGTDPATAIQILHDELEALSPGYPFDIRPFDEQLERAYKNEQRLATLISLFSLLAVLISIAGVFGLVVFDSEYRRKEICIRRVMGASVGNILLMFNKSYLWILLVCFIIACPIAWYAVNEWLQSFAYRVPSYWWIFPVALLIVGSVTLLTVTYQNWHAANENPVNSIKNE